MSEFMFGCGAGHLSKSAAKAANENDAVLVNSSDPQCKCGHGCSPHKCPASKRHWFSARNYGSPFDQATAKAVIDAVKKVATKSDKKLLGL